jgi:hypothetical protein
MNIDIFSQVDFGDAEGLRGFFLAHRFTHAQTALALAVAGSGVTPGGGLWGQLYEDSWIEQMRATLREEPIEVPPAVRDWLNQHAQLHQDEYSALSIGDVPDLSNVNFGSPSQFYDWMDAHRQVHDIVAGVLRIS